MIAVNDATAALGTEPACSGGNNDVATRLDLPDGSLLMQVEGPIGLKHGWANSKQIFVERLIGDQFGHGAPGSERWHEFQEWPFMHPALAVQQLSELTAETFVIEEEAAPQVAAVVFAEVSG